MEYTYKRLFVIEIYKEFSQNCSRMNLKVKDLNFIYMKKSMIDLKFR